MANNSQTKISEMESKTGCIWQKVCFFDSIKTINVSYLMNSRFICFGQGWLYATFTIATQYSRGMCMHVCIHVFTCSCIFKMVCNSVLHAIPDINTGRKSDSNIYRSIAIPITISIVQDNDFDIWSNKCFNKHFNRTE